MTDISRLKYTLFVVDLEFVGNVSNISTCKIWEIAAVLVQNNKIMDTFQKVVDPCPDSDVVPLAPDGCFSPTKTFLVNQKAKPLPHVLRAFVRWIKARTVVNTKPLFVAHGAFRADKPVLENDAFVNKFRLPTQWMWADSLYMARCSLPGRSDYGLSTLVREMQTDYIQTHRALDDAIALANLITSVICIQGFAYPVYSVPLCTIPGIGCKTEQKLIKAGVNSKAHLKQCLITIGRNNDNQMLYAMLWLQRLIQRSNDETQRIMQYAFCA